MLTIQTFSVAGPRAIGADESTYRETLVPVGPRATEADVRP
jgi:hypothetical protein